MSTIIIINRIDKFRSLFEWEGGVRIFYFNILYFIHICKKKKNTLQHKDVH